MLLHLFFKDVRNNLSELFPFLLRKGSLSLCYCIKFRIFFRNSFNGLGGGMPSYMDLERIFILRVIKNIDI